MKKISFLLLLTASILLVGCSKSTEKDQETSNPNEQLTEDQTDTKENGDSTEEAIEDSESENDSNVSSEIKTEPETENEEEENMDIVAQVQMHEGRYFDEREFYYASMPESEATLVSCEIIVSNITDTSFDFTIYEKTTATDQSVILIPTATAVFIEDGTKAAYYGEEQSLVFTFPDNHGAYPVVTDINVSGFEPMEGNTYVNNSIPGHEFG